MAQKAPLKVLIIGGYGTFGGSLARLLAEEAGLELVIAGRSLARAEAFCGALDARAGLRPVRFDRDGKVIDQIAVLAPNMVVDASGPWQAYGELPYRVVEACIALGTDYLDLADGSDFVEGVGKYDAAARAAGVVVLSGVSTCPALTAAAARRLAAGMDRVDAIAGGIAPSPHARLGLNVIKAIAAYAGRPVGLMSEGGAAYDWGLMSRRRVTIGVPGQAPLDHRLFSLVDVPDLKLLSKLWPEVGDVWIGAAPVPEMLHRALNAAAWGPRLGLTPSLARFAPLFHAVVERRAPGGSRPERQGRALRPSALSSSSSFPALSLVLAGSAKKRSARSSDSL